MSHSNGSLSCTGAPFPYHVGTFVYVQTGFDICTYAHVHIRIKSSIEVKYYFNFWQVFNLNISQIAQRRLAEIRDVRGSLAGIPIIVVSIS